LNQQATTQQDRYFPGTCKSFCWGPGDGRTLANQEVFALAPSSPDHADSTRRLSALIVVRGLR